MRKIFANWTLGALVLYSSIPALSQCKLIAVAAQSGNTTTYTYTLDSQSAALVCTAPKILVLPVPQTYDTLVTAPAGICLKQYANNAATYNIGSACAGAAAPPLPLIFTLTAPSDTTAPWSTNIQYTITDGAGKNYHDYVNVPVEKTAIPVAANPLANSPTSIDLLLGAGSHIAGSIPIDYKVETNSVLASTGVGRAVPVLLAGLGFTFAPLTLQPKDSWIKYVMPNTAFISLQVSSNPSNTGIINGYTFGLGYKVQTYLEVMAGYSLSPQSEPSYGFRQAAAQTVKANPTVPIYQRFNVDDILNNKPNALDGFPLLLQSTSGTAGGPIYPGDSLVTHYRGGLFVGVAFPLSLSKYLVNH